MLFSVLIYGNEDLIDALSQEEMDALMKKHGAFHEQTKTNRSFAIASKLMSTGTAVTVAQDGDEFVVTDGPFAETKEQFLGFYVVDCPTLEDAIAAVKLLPLDHHRIELRPVDYFEGADFQNAERVVISAS